MVVSRERQALAAFLLGFPLGLDRGLFPALQVHLEAPFPLRDALTAETLALWARTAAVPPFEAERQAPVEAAARMKA